MTAVVRWKFTDVRTGTSYTVPINPNEGGTPTISKQVATNMPMGPNRKAVFSEGRLSITDMQFAGMTLTQAHLEALQTWALKRTLIQIDDDLHRTFQGVITSLSLSRSRRAFNSWFHTYSASFGITYMRDASGVVQYGATAGTVMSAMFIPPAPVPAPPPPPAPITRPPVDPPQVVTPPITPSSAARVVTYAKPTGAPDAVWKTWIGGVATWTHYTTRGATAHYSTDAAAPVSVTMTAPATVTSLEVEVSQEGVWPPPTVSATFTGKNISFTLPGGFHGHVMVRINSALPSAGWQSFCTVSALPLETDVPATGAVSYYFGPGVHTGSTISLESNATVYIDGGALVKRRLVAGAIGTNTTGQRSNIRIWGRGIIDTSNGYGPTDQGMGTGDFAGVSGLTFEGVGYVSRYSWALAAYRCINAMFDRVRVFSCEIPDAPDYPGQGTPDGIDPIGCNGFTVKRSLISAADDSSAIKMSKYGMEGDANNHLYEDLLLIQGGKSNGMDIGYELGNSNLSVTNITYRRVYAPICWRDSASFRAGTLSIHLPTKATVDGVLYEDCRFDEARNKDWDLFVSNFYFSGGFGSTSGDANRGYLRNITYRRVELPGDKPIRITADLTDPNYEGGAKKITNVTFDSCTRAGVPLTAVQSDWTVTNVANLVFSYTNLPAASPGLFFDASEIQQPGAHTHLSFPHWWPFTVRSWGNTTNERDDWYSTGMNNPESSSYADSKKWGGDSRARPMFRPPLSGTTEQWNLADRRFDIDTAIDYGHDGFFVDIISSWKGRIDQLAAALRTARTQNPGRYGNFVIIPMIDANSTGAYSPTSTAAEYLLTFDDVSKHVGGKMLWAVWHPGARAVSVWQDISQYMAGEGVPNQMVGTWNSSYSDGTNGPSAYGSLTYGEGPWGAGNADPAHIASAASAVAGYSAAAHSRGKIFVNPLRAGEVRPSDKGPWFDESANSEALVAQWNQVINLNADWIEPVTWSDWTEDTGFAPGTHYGYARLLISAWFMHKWKTGSYPTILKDAIVLSHRQHKLNASVTYAGQTDTLPQRGTSNVTTPRDKVEARVWLTAPARVDIIDGAGTQQFNAPAGMSAYLKNLTPGPAPLVRVVRSGQVVAEVQSVRPVDATPYRTDWSYWMFTNLHDSRRQSRIPGPNPPYS